MSTLNIPPSTTLSSLLVCRIRSDIIRGAFSPGSRLRTSELSKRYNASPIPLREALSRLASTGFVVAEDQRGFSVARVSIEELADITSTRLLIEGDALRRSIDHGDVAWEAALIAAHHRLTRTPMLLASHQEVDSKWEDAHTAFHEALLAACDSRWLLSIAAMLRDQTSRYRHLSLEIAREQNSDSAEHRDVGAEHEALMSAALSRNADLAVELLTEHFQRTTELVMQLAEAKVIQASAR